MQDVCSVSSFAPARVKTACICRCGCLPSLFCIQLRLSTCNCPTPSGTRWEGLQGRRGGRHLTSRYLLIGQKGRGALLLTCKSPRYRKEGGLDATLPENEIVNKTFPLEVFGFDAGTKLDTRQTTYDEIPKQRNISLLSPDNHSQTAALIYSFCF